MRDRAHVDRRIPPPHLGDEWGQKSRDEAKAAPEIQYSLVTLHSNGFAEGIHVEGRLYSVQRRLILQGVKVLAPGSTHLTVLDQALRDCAM